MMNRSTKPCVFAKRLIGFVARSAMLSALGVIVSGALLVCLVMNATLTPVSGVQLKAVEITPVADIVIAPAVITIPAISPRPHPADVQQPDAQPTFNGRSIRPVRQIKMLVTAYSPDHRSCGKWADGRTASGKSVWTNGMKLVAADTRLLPLGSIVTVPGYHNGRPVPVLDRGGKIKGKRMDLLYPTHDSALQWGAQRLEVTVWEYAD
jgi:3D (Asp-Asp-Asp) domain-containing protein